MIKTLTNIFKQDKEKFVVPKGVQDVIPIKAIYDDGIFLVGKDKFAKSFKFSDINYAVASREDKEAMFLEYSELLNSFDKLAELLNISDLQMSYITNVEAGHGLIKVGSSLVPFANKFPKNTKLYKLMTTKPGESA